MSSILEELRKKREEEEKQRQQATKAQRISESATSANSYKKVLDEEEELKKKTQKALDTVNKLRIPKDPLSKKNQKIVSTVEDDYSRPAGDTIQSNQGGVANISLIDAGKAAVKGAETVTKAVAKAVAPVVKNEIKTTKDIIVSDVAQIRAGLKTFTDENQALALAKLDANKLLKYAKGEKGILNALEFNRLKNSNKTKTIPAVAVMADEISRGTYKGTAEDIKKILKQGDDQAYTIWYNRNVAPFVNKAQQSANTNTSMYGETAGNVMNTVANIGAKGLEFFGLSNVAGPIAAGGALGFSEGSSKIVPKVQSGYTVEEASRDIAVDTAKGAAFVALFQAASPILNKGINPSVTGVQRAAQSMVNGFLTTTGISLGTQALDLLKKDPDFDFIDWNEFEAGAKSGKYKDLQDYMNSDAFAKHVAGNRAAQVLVSATVASLFNTYNVMKNMSINENRLVTAKEAAKFNPKRTTYLKTLGLNEGATDEEIQAAFRRLSRELYVGGTVAPENLERWYAIVEAKNGLLPKEVLNTIVRTSTQPQQQTTSNVVPVNNTPTNVARPTQQATVVPPPSTLTTVPQAQPSTAITPSATQGTVLTKENYYDVLRAATPLLDEKEVTEETLRLMDNYDLGAFDDRTLDKIQRQAEKNVFDKFAQTDEGKRLIASYKDGELQPIKAEKKDFSGGYTTAEGTPITNGIAKWAKNSAMKTDGKPDSYYHGSPFLFEEFKDTYTHNGKSLGDGYYLSKNKDWVKKNYAYSKGDKVYELVLNAKNPFNEEAWLKDKENIIKEAPQIAETFFPNVSPETFAEDIEYGRYFKDEEPTAYDTVKTITEYAQKNGVDTRKIWDWLGYDGIDIDGEVVIFKSNQAKYLDNPYPTSRPAFVAEPDDLEYELMADKVAFVDTEEGSKAWKEYQEKEKVQDDIRMQILQEMEQKGYVEHRVENGDVKDYLTEKGMQNQAEVDEYQKRFYAALDETQRLRDEYDKLEKAYEEEQKRKFFENSTQGSFSMPKNLPEELPAEKRKFLKEFKQVGYVNIKGVKVTSVDDLADVAQVFRDPIAETFRVIFMKGDTIVGQSGYTTGSVRAVGIGNSRRFAGQIDLWADGFGADSYYLIHNHPDGRVEPSSGDIAVTKNLASYTNIPLKGHIVIDHNEFSAIYRDGTTQKHIKLKNNTYNEIEKDFSKEGWANTPVKNMDQIAALSSYVKNDKDFSTVIWTDSKYVPTVLQSLPNSFFEGNSKSKIVEYMQKVGRENGADYVMFATQKPSAFMSIKEKAPNTPAVVLYTAKDDGSLSVVNASRSQQLHLYNNNRKNPQQIAPMEGVQMQEPSTSLEEIKKQYEQKQPEAKKEPPKKLEPKKKEQPAKTEKKQPAKRLEKKAVEKKETKKEPIKKLEKKKPEPDKRLGFDAIDKDKEALEKANNQLRDELAKQKKEYEERLKKKDEVLEKFKQTKKEQREKQKLKLKKREEKKKEEQRFKSATPKGKLRMLGRKIEKQTGYYEINNYPELDKKYEEEFGKTIRQTIQTLKTRDIYPYLPAKFQDIVDTFADETYLKANWKTFDKYVKEALQIDEIKKLIEESDTPVANRLLGIIREHKTAPITVKTIKEMYDDLQILEGIVELAQERLDYRREPEGWKETVDKAGEELKEIAEGNTPKSFSTASAKLGKASDNLQSLGSTFSQFKTRIQELFGGDPENPFMRIWDEFQAGDEKKAMLDVLFSRNFDGLVEGKPGKYKMKGELQKDFSENAKPIDTGIKGTNPKTGKEYSENAMLPKKIIMHIVASSKNDDNLMSFSKILLGTDYKGNPVYSNPGGYIVPDDYYLQRGNINLAYKNGKKYVFTKQDIEHLEKLLTPEEKEFVDAALKVGDITAKYGNEVSQKLIGRDLFTVKNYIRIIRDESEFDPELIDPTKLDNLANATSEKYIGISGLLGRGGSLEGRNHRSTRPIYGESLRQSVTNSFRGAIKYIAYALPLYDTDFLLKARLPDTFEKIETTKEEPKSTKDLTYKKVDELPRNGAEHTRYYMDNGDHYTVYRVKEKGETVRDLIIKTGDKGFDDYYNQFVDSIVGKGKPYSKFSSMRAKVVLNANLRVAATQFFSYFQMGQFLDHPTSSMLKAIADRGTIAKLAKDFLEKDGKDIKGLKGQELINRFIEYISYKNSQRGLGMFSDDIRYVETGNSVLGRVNTGRLMSIVDKFTVDRTYKALMYDIMAEGKEFGSKEFMDEFKSRLYAIYQSNPMYGEIYKTPFQNNTGRYSEITRALSQFQTVMFEGFNNGKQAKMAYEYYKKKGDEKNAKKYAKRFRHHIQGLIISGLALVALRDYLDRLAKKENDEEYAKKITMDFISNMLSYTIVGDEIFNAWFKLNNYDLTTNELSYFNTAFDAFGDMGTLAKEPTPPNAIKLIKSLGQTLGLPAGSLENTFGILSNLTPGNAFSAYSVLKDNNKYQKWLKNQDAIGTDFKTFYEISQAVKEKTLAEKYGYVKGSETGTYGSLSYAKGRAIMDVLGIEQGKKMTKEQKQAYSKWYNIFKN